LSGTDGYGPDNSTNDTTQIRQPLFDHITDKLSSVGDRVTEWDVVNHPVGWGPDTYEDVLGSDIYIDIINHARAAARNLEMWMNEDNVLNGGNVANNYERIINHMIDNGAAPDGIGIQGHFKSSWGRNRNSTTESIYQQLERFSNVVDRIQLTEFDIDVSTTDSEGNEIYDETEHARLMREYLVSAFSHESLEGITMWGFWENAHWLSPAALYNSDWTEREALLAYQDLVFGDWWTEEQGLTDSSGQFSLRGFKGDYDIIVEYDNQTITRSFNSDAGSASIVVGVPEPTRAIPLASLVIFAFCKRRRQNFQA
jgi:GH35 family endo-1,4-beta-xylanase